MTRNSEFSEVAFEAFSPLKDLGFTPRRVSAHFIVLDSEALEILIKYDDYSGYVNVVFVNREGKDDFSWEDLAEAIGKPLQEYPNGIYAYKIEDLKFVLPKAAALLQKHCCNLLRGDENEFMKVLEISQRRETAELHSMMYGALRTQAEEAWNNFDYNKYIDLMLEIPEAHQVTSEIRKINIARLKMSKQ